MKCAFDLGYSAFPSSKSAQTLWIGSCPGDEEMLQVPGELTVQGSQIN